MRIINNEILEDGNERCTWKGCNNIAKHKTKGSLINLCDKHKKELDSTIGKLWHKER